MKISLKSIIYSSIAASFLVGCGGGGGSAGNTVSNKTATVQASDAYVVSLITPATLKVDGKEYNTTKVGPNGEVIFIVPDDLNLTNAEIHIPADAIVDADGDGKLSVKDQIIRMSLSAKGKGAVANPLATVALSKNDIQAYGKFKDFDPVKAKEELINNPDNDQLKALVAVNDAIASIIKEANTTNPNAVLKDINIDKIKEIVNSNSSVADITALTVDTIQNAADKAGINDSKITDKIEEILNVIRSVHNAIKNGKIKSHKDALKAVLAVSDADVNESVVNRAIEDGNITDIETHIREDERVGKHMKHRHDNDEHDAHKSGHDGDHDGVHDDHDGEHKSGHDNDEHDAHKSGHDGDHDGVHDDHDGEHKSGHDNDEHDAHKSGHDGDHNNSDK